MITEYKGRTIEIKARCDHWSTPTVYQAFVNDEYWLYRESEVLAYLSAKAEIDKENGLPDFADLEASF